MTAVVLLWHCPTLLSDPVITSSYTIRVMNRPPTNTQFPVSVSLRVDFTLYIAEVERLFLMNVSLNLVEPQWVSPMHVQLVM